MAGGAISGGMTLVSLQTQSQRLKANLRTLPPPGVDAALYAATIATLDAQKAEEDPGVAQKSVSAAVDGARAGTQAVTGAAKSVAARAKGVTGSLLAKARSGRPGVEPSTDVEEVTDAEEVVQEGTLDGGDTTGA